ncbi:GMC oxidoreductase [Amanita thiersii Skay4041]|uniref:GMC oxidoreductase n=1 Tax=Amanita thiersii Skay4041 TaxID=703135 RepID=A0A2A9NQN7_9AGAR|nr:GMC oxidoreductase [Amanita thiersii Skay4041]
MLKRLVWGVLGAVVAAGGVNALLIFLNDSSMTANQVLSQQTFDYIIVGGGTTGLTVAWRLAETQSKRILVLEAGRSGVNDSLVTVPQHSFSFIGTDIDWFYFTQPQQFASGQRINLSSGKVLGGDSAVNGLVWTRPSKTEYDAFEALGAKGWNWNSMYAAMKKSEKINIPDAVHVQEFGYSVVPSSLGNSGPVDVSFPPFIPLQHQKFINASQELGHELNLDPYSGGNTGAYWSLSSQTSSAVRETSEFAYFDPVLATSNLIVLAEALVTKININTGVNASATGVEIRFPDGSIHTARLKSRGEVILSAGSIHTPQLLELSGIGNKDILNQFGIDVKVHLPGVGENYEDHPLTILTYKLKPGFLSFDALGYNATLKAEQEELYKKGQGWLTFANSGLNFSPIDKILNETEMQEARSILSQKPPNISQEQFDIVKDQIFNDVTQAEYLLFNSFSAGTNKEPNTSYVSMAITHLHPLSRGNIHIATTSIDDHPNINPNVLMADWDRWFLAKASAYARRFFQTQSFQEIFEPEEVFPGFQIQTQAQWEQYVKDNINLGYHSVGTASMLPRDKNGVVDAQLKVYGTCNIRVADVSIMPLLISAHTQVRIASFV